MTFVEAIYIDPWTDILPRDTVMRFRVLPNPDVKVESLEFRVLQLRSHPQQEWVTIQNWRPFPIVPQLPRFEGPSAFHVDVRLGASGPIQSCWLGNVIIADTPQRTVPPILRLLSLPFWSGSLSFGMELDLFQQKLSACFDAMEAQFFGAPRKGATWTSVASGVQIDLAAHKHYAACAHTAGKVLGPIASNPIARKAIWSTLAIAEGFKRASPAGRGLNSLTQAAAHCNSMTYLLQSILLSWKIPARAIEIHWPPDAGHAFIECKLDQGHLCLDPYAGLVGLGHVDQLRMANEPRCLSLFDPYPPIFDMLSALRAATKVMATNELSAGSFFVDASRGDKVYEVAAAAE
jgi:hypothetical protein